MARCYCEPCHFFDDSPDREIFHCDKCQLCRRGKAEDYWHCDGCHMCLAQHMRPDRQGVRFSACLSRHRVFAGHVCHTEVLKQNCPICTEFMFTSREPVQFLS
jgi:zinc finger-like protein